MVLECNSGLNSTNASLLRHVFFIHSWSVYHIDNEPVKKNCLKIFRKISSKNYLEKLQKFVQNKCQCHVEQ
jgi:hypothetical protein